MAWTLCSKQDVISIHPVQADYLQDFWSDAVESLIRKHVNAPNLGVPTVVVAEKHDGDGSPILVTNNPNIISVQAIRVSDVALVSGDYVSYGSHIALISGVFPAGFGNIAIDYTLGSATVDPLVRFTAATMVVAVVNYKRRMGADASIKWGNANDGTEMDNKSANINIGLTSHMKVIMTRMLPREKILLG